MFWIGICDDEAFYREDLYKRINHYFKDKDLEIEVRVYESGAELLKDNEQRAFDLVFLDIEMPGMDGMTVGKALRKTTPELFLFFVTSHGNFVSEAFRLNASQYLQKPIRDIEFEGDIERVLKQYYLRKKAYNFEYKGVKKSIPIFKIIYFESSYWNVYIHTEKESYKIVGQLDNEEKKLKYYYFVRIHQSFLVNMSYIDRFLSDKVFLRGMQDPLVVSRKYKEAAKKCFLNYQSKVGI